MRYTEFWLDSVISFSINYFFPLQNIDLSTLNISSVMLKAYILVNKQTNKTPTK